MYRNVQIPKWVKNQMEHHIILTKYEAVHPTAVLEKYSSSGMLIILIKVFLRDGKICMNNNEKSFYNVNIYILF